MNASTHMPGGGSLLLRLGLGLRARARAARWSAWPRARPARRRPARRTAGVSGVLTRLRRCGRPLAVHSVTTGTSSSMRTTVGGPGSAVRWSGGASWACGWGLRAPPVSVARARRLAPMPWASPGAGSVVSMSRGTTRTARTPPYADGAQRDLDVVRPARAGRRRRGRGAGYSPRSLRSMPCLGPARACPRPGAGLLAEADAAVLDLDGDAGLHLDGGDVHLGLRRRVARGVVEQFGAGVDERLDGGADDGDLGDRVQLDALVVQDPGHGAAQHAVQRDGLGPLRGRGGRRRARRWSRRGGRSARCRGRCAAGRRRPRGCGRGPPPSPAVRWPAGGRSPGRGGRC